MLTTLHEYELALKGNYEKLRDYSEHIQVFKFLNHYIFCIHLSTNDIKNWTDTIVTENNLHIHKEGHKGKYEN